MRAPLGAVRLNIPTRHWAARGGPPAVDLDHACAPVPAPATCAGATQLLSGSLDVIRDMGPQLANMVVLYVFIGLLNRRSCKHGDTAARQVRAQRNRPGWVGPAAGTSCFQRRAMIRAQVAQLGGPNGCPDACKQGSSWMGPCRGGDAMLMEACAPCAPADAGGDAAVGLHGHGGLQPAGQPGPGELAGLCVRRLLPHLHLLLPEDQVGGVCLPLPFSLESRGG